jgi:hypothetical protein
MSKVIGIIGSRRRDEKADCKLAIAALKKVWKRGDTFVSGGCQLGGDRFAKYISVEWEVPLKEHLPDKSKLDPVLMSKNPRAAYAVINYARNKLIARDADVLIAVVAPDRKGGTEDTIKHFRNKFCHHCDQNKSAHVTNQHACLRFLTKTEKQLIAEGRLILV